MDHVLPKEADFFPPRARLAFNAAAPAAGVMALNVLAMLLGWGANLPTLDEVAAAPPAWFIGVVWLGIYASLGVARWDACRVSDRACDRSRWVTGVLVWGVAYAFLAGAFGPVWSLVHAASLLALAAMACARVAPTSRRAAAWLAAPLLWMGYTVVLSVLALNIS